MIRQRALAELGPWIERASTTLVASFANGVTKDIAAVTAAILSGWSNGQIEGQTCKLKLIKRQMYGRGKLDLLQARNIGLALGQSSAKVRQTHFFPRRNTLSFEIQARNRDVVRFLFVMDACNREIIA